MQNFTEIYFEWIDETVPCPDENLKNKNYKFYSKCEINNIKFEAGTGVIARIESKPHVGVVHYFYEIPDCLPKAKKYIAALELFYKPKDIEGGLKRRVKLDKDLEVVKKNKVILVHVPVYAIKDRCAVVYGLKDEDPQELFHEFVSTTNDTIYVCRYLASFADGFYHLSEAIYNEDDKNKIIEISDDDNSPYKHLSAGNYSVSVVENLKIKLKRALNTPKQSDELPDSSKPERHVPRILARKSLRRTKQTPPKFLQSSSELSKNISQSPSELMKNLSLSPKKEILSLEEVKGIVQTVKAELVFNNSDEDIKNTEEIQQAAAVLHKIESLEQVETSNQSIKEELLSSSDEDMKTTEEIRQPIVVLNKIDMNVNTPRDRRSARHQSNVCTPSRTSKRQTPRVSYAKFYELEEISPEKRYTRSIISKDSDDYIVLSPKPNTKQQVPRDSKIENLAAFKGTVTPRKTRNSVTEENAMIVEVIPRKTRKNSITEVKEKIVEVTPRRSRKQSVTFEETSRNNKNNEFEETNSIRQKRSSSTVDVTPKKQSKIMNTPRSGRLNIMTMTPTIEEREEPIVYCNTPMSRARMGLSAYSVPTKMPCRENEYMNIYSFVTGRLVDQSSGCMYISGVPGTGKTMTVCRVMNDLSDQKDEYSDFVFLKLNALALTEPRQIYVEIIKKLLNKKLHWEESLKEIQRFFKAKKKKIAHVILVDELDKLCNRKQDVVYNLLDLPFHSVTPLIVITIANTMDLPERILTNKVNSRLGLVRLTFKPYQYKDLVKIVTERLATDAVFKNEALELVARKVAAVSGDARRALAMCSRATEIAEEEDKDLVTMDVVDRVIKEMSSSSKVQAIQCCSKLEQLVLSAIASEVTRTGNEEVPFLNMLQTLNQLSVLESFKLPSPEVCLRSCHNLGSFRLLITQHGRIDINMTLMLNISTDDVHYALRN